MSSFILIHHMKTTGTNQCRHNQPQTSVSKLRLIGPEYGMQNIYTNYGGNPLFCKGSKIVSKSHSSGEKRPGHV